MRMSDFGPVCVSPALSLSQFGTTAHLHKAKRRLGNSATSETRDYFTHTPARVNRAARQPKARHASGILLRRGHDGRIKYACARRDGFIINTVLFALDRIEYLDFHNNACSLPSYLPSLVLYALSKTITSSLSLSLSLAKQSRQRYHICTSNHSAGLPQRIYQ